jgi:hypothetical protein
MQAWSHTRAIAESMNIISSYNKKKKNPSLLEDPILSQIYKRITEFKLFFIIINLASQYPKSKPVQTLRTVNHLCYKKKAIKAWKIERTKTFWLEPSTGKLWQANSGALTKLISDSSGIHIGLDRCKFRVNSI